MWFRWLNISFKKQLELYNEVEELGTVMARVRRNSKPRTVKRKRKKTNPLTHPATQDGDATRHPSGERLEADREMFLQGRMHDKVLIAMIYMAILFSGHLVTVEDLVRLVLYYMCGCELIPTTVNPEFFVVKNCSLISIVRSR